jgi:hypothetical protein
MTVKEKFSPYIVDDLIPLKNGLVYHKRKRYRTKTKYDWMPAKVDTENYSIEWRSCFDTHQIKDFENGYFGDILSGNKNIPLEYHYGNSATLFILNLLIHLKTKNELIANLDKWCNYYRKHVTDSLSNYSGDVLVAMVYIQRAGLGSSPRQEYFDHTLAEIESTDIKPYYYIEYELFDDHIMFYTNGIYKKSYPAMEVSFLNL